MHRPRIRRRLFLSGAVASATLGRALAQAPALSEFTQRYTALLERFAATNPGAVRACHVVTVPGNARPWIDTGIDLSVGEQLSFVADGRVYLSRAANLWLLPRVALWARVGDADVFRPGSDTYTFRAENGGRLQLATLQGRWATPRGDHPAPAAYDAIEGSIDVLIVRWGNVDAQRAFEALAAAAPGDARIEAELSRLRAPITLPQGFAPLWYVGSGDNFAHGFVDGEPVIALRSLQSGGVIRAPLSLALEPGLTVTWEWRVYQLPSRQAENFAPFHQYVSLALEFDDGQDLSWYWSASLTPDTHYACPFPNWPGETHLVVRSGAADTRRWLRERREVAEDVAAALPRRPARVTGLWLIASTVFGDRLASVDFRSISVTDAQGKTQRLFPT